MTGHDAQPDDALVTSTPVGTRRRFFAWVTKIAMGVIGVGLAVPLISYAVAPALKRRESSWNEIGPIDQLPAGEPEQLEFVNSVKDGWRTASVKKVVWAIKQPAGTVVVFSPSALISDADSDGTVTTRSSSAPVTAVSTM